MRTVFLILLCTHTSIFSSQVPKQHQSRGIRSIQSSETLTTVERARSQGYPAEAHEVLTEDGYILELHRIPFGKKGPQNSIRPVVLLMHCLMCSSNDWLLHFTDKALGFILADRGYDVWMVNARGNIYSRKHVSLSPEKRKFWLFSWHEISKYDLPASIDFALRHTGAEKLSYIGYSMGSAVFYALMSIHPEYNEKVSAAAIVGPAAYMTHSKGSFFQFSPFVNIIEKISDLLGLWEFRMSRELQNIMASTLCSKRNSHLLDLCLAIYSLTMDIDSEFANRDFLPFILSNIPAGGSLRTLLHFMQVKNAARFQQYDHGRSGNLKRYGTSEPPLYYINKTKTPIGLFTAKGDKFVTKPDVDRLASELPNVVYKYEVPMSKFSHFDFLWSKDSTNILFDFIIDFLQDYSWGLQ